MKRICIDAGHYGKYNRSPANGAYYESEAMWKLHLLQKKYLEAYGFEVILTRDSQAKDKALVERGKMAKGCVLFLSNHSNAVGNGVNESVDYPLSYVMMQDGNSSTSYDDISHVLGMKLAQTVGQVMGCTQPARVTTRSLGSDRDGDGRLDADDEYYGVLYGARQVKVPGFILENSFHTNTRMTNWLLNDSNLDRLAKAEATAIAEYFGAKKKIIPISGSVKVTYTGSDGINVRNSPNMGDNVNHVVHGGTYSVIGISEDMEWYKLDSGLFLTSNIKYVKFTKDVVEPYMIRVDVSEIYDHCLNVRAEANAASTIIDTIREDMTLTIVAEKNGFGLLKAYAEKRNGWIKLQYVKKV